MLNCYFPKYYLLGKDVISKLFPDIKINFIDYDSENNDIHNTFYLDEVLENRMNTILKKECKHPILIFDYSLVFLEKAGSPGATVNQQADIMGLTQFVDLYAGYVACLEFRILFYDGKTTHDYCNILIGIINNNWASNKYLEHTNNWLLAFAPRGSWFNLAFVDMSDADIVKYHTAFYSLIKVQSKVLKTNFKNKKQKLMYQIMFSLNPQSINKEISILQLFMNIFNGALDKIKYYKTMSGYHILKNELDNEMDNEMEYELNNELENDTDIDMEKLLCG
jgi:hypothetical protein